MAKLIIKGTDSLKAERLEKHLRRPEILLQPQIPKPLHEVNPRTILGKTWWDIERRKAYNLHNYKCHVCGYNPTLNPYRKLLDAHEIYEYDYPNGRAYFREVVALCYYCHSFIHLGRAIIMNGQGKISNKEFDSIEKYGNKILKEAHLTKRDYQGKVAVWENWRLVINGIEHEPKFKSFHAWAKHYGVQIKILYDNSDDYYDDLLDLDYHGDN